ncbi:MAG: NPCBM/NEW2 domain-containing protein [Bacillota bacterium]
MNYFKSGEREEEVMLKRLLSIVFCMTVLLTLFTVPQPVSAATVALDIQASRIKLQVGTQSYEFVKDGLNLWAFDGVWVNGIKTVSPVNNDYFFVGSGKATGYTVISNSGNTKEIQFRGADWTVNFKVDSTDRLPLYHISIEGLSAATVQYRTVAIDPDQRGTLLTRGIVKTDAQNLNSDNRSFIDGANPVVFAHSKAGDVDAACVILPVVNKHINPNRTTEQACGTYIRNSRVDAGGGNYYGLWQLEMRSEEPKSYRILFDRDLGGRIHDVCEKYYADVVDTIGDNIATHSIDSRINTHLDKFPVVMVNPEMFKPNAGWKMGETSCPPDQYPGTGFAAQNAQALYYHGIATGQEWEKSFASYVMNNFPWINSGLIYSYAGYPTGCTNSHDDVNNGFYRQHYSYGLMSGDIYQRNLGIDIMRYSANVKFDPVAIRYPGKWDNVTQTDLGATPNDDMYTAAFAGMAVKAYEATGDNSYLEKADLAMDFFFNPMWNESRFEYFRYQNTWGVPAFEAMFRAFKNRYERTGDSRYLDVAKDVVWIQIMTISTVSESLGRTTCGTRGCQDYDCSPNLCWEQDHAVYLLAGPLLDTVGAHPAYMKYFELAYFAVAADAANNGWGCDTTGANYRTAYDTEVRAMANLMYTLNYSTDNRVTVVEKRVSYIDPDIDKKRDMLVGNGTGTPRTTTIKIRYLKPGIYNLVIDGVSQGNKTHMQLNEGVTLTLASNEVKSIQVNNISLDTETTTPHTYDDSVTYLSDCVDAGSSGVYTGSQQFYSRNKNAAGGPINLAGTIYDKGLGMRSSNAILYDLNGAYETFKARVGIDNSVSGYSDPAPSVNFTVFTDTGLKFDSGTVTVGTAPIDITIDVRGVKKLILRMSNNWDNVSNYNPDGHNDLGNWANARLEGKDPAIPGLMPYGSTPPSGDGPEGYTWCANEGDSYDFGTNIVDVAYGANGFYNYLYRRTGIITFDNATFGDPIVGVVKKGYYKLSDEIPVGGVTCCEHYFYEGYNVVLAPGEYTTSQMLAAGISDNSMSSIKVPPGYTVIGYDGDNFTGESWTFTSDTPEFGTLGCNDKISSIKVLYQ